MAVTHGPGLAGALLIGVNAAKGYAMAKELPFVGINHLEGHIYAAWLEDADPESGPGFPLLCPYSVGRPHRPDTDGRPRAGSRWWAAHGTTRLARHSTRPRACWAWDSPAARRSSACRNAADGQEPRLPRPRVRDSLDFSFSGLKSALVRRAEERGLYPPHPDRAADPQKVANVAREFQEAIVDTMVRRTLEAV